MTLNNNGTQVVAYQSFLERKVAIADQYGFECDPEEIHPILLPHQRDIVCWAVRGGRRALFESFGLGKTVQQLEILRLILKKAGSGRALIVCPLGVRQEFKRDAAMLEISTTFVRTNEEVEQLSLIDNPPEIFITNYESVREGKIDPRRFTAVSLDECAILRSFGGTATFRKLMQLFEGSGKEFHLCPLQFDIVDRTITQFSMKGETVLDVFMGLGTVPYCAVKLGRKGIGFELSESYFQDAVYYLKQAEQEQSVQTLFELLDGIPEEG